ncbi:unnamed protein product [Prunus brigantina]
MQAQMWFSAISQGKKSFNNHQCWEVVKNCLRFKIIFTGPTIVLNETPLHNSPASDLPLESPMNQDHQSEGSRCLLGERWQRPREGVIQPMIVQNFWSKLLSRAQ